MTSDDPPPERRAWRTDAEWRRLQERINETGHPVAVARPPFRRPVAWAAAAALVVAVGLAWQTSQRESTPAVAVERVATTGVGERLEVRLDDSSLVTLGPRSVLRYTVSGAVREVRLDGIADFTVAHDATRPFVVRAKNAAIVDIGTAFVVRAYAADSTVDVAVTSGVVALSGTGSQPIELRAGKAGRVNSSGAPSVTPALAAATSSRKMAAWIEGRLVFDDAPLADVAAELRRWFDVDISVPDARLARRRVTAVYTKPSLVGTLDALTATLGARHTSSGRLITITPGAP